MPRLTPQERRRAAVAKLRAEGRPIGPPPMGWKHSGPKDNRYRVPDLEAREIVKTVIRLRDQQGLSWDKISDRVHQFLAAKHGRAPTLRCNRPTWTGGMCRLRYLRAKAQGVDGQFPEATHRRCTVCGRSLPVSEFSRCGRYRRRTCRLCRVVRSFVRREEKNRRDLVGCLRELSRLANLGRLHSARGKEIWDKLEELFGTPETMAAEWFRYFKTTVQRKPASRATVSQFNLIVALLQPCKRRPKGPMSNRTARGRSRKEPDFGAMSDEQLERAIERHRKLQALRVIKGESP